MNEDRAIPMSELSKLTSLSAATIYRRIKKGRFPPPIELGENRVAWLASEVQEWLKTRPRTIVSTSVERE